MVDRAEEEDEVGKSYPAVLIGQTASLTAGTESSAAVTRRGNGFDAFDAGLVTVNYAGTRV